MNLWILSANYARHRPLNTVLNVLLLALGIATITVLLLLSRQVEGTLTRNSRGIDLVVGAKGSPLQIILSSVFHADFPTGNISLADVRPLQRNRLIKNMIPLALGDSYRGYRIVGTNYDYPALYEAKLRVGDWWQKPLDVTLGAEVAAQLQLAPGAEFNSSHGLADDRINVHDEQAFRVSGVLAPTGSVVDNLILTAVESVWAVHEEHADSVAHESPVAQDSITQRGQSSPGQSSPGLPLGKEGQEITALLLQYRSPMAAVQLPRFINQRTNLQAASPPFEVARLFTLVGVGVDGLRGFAYVLVLIAALSTFIALYNALRERRYDLAVMRSLGASRWTLFLLMILEGVTISAVGGVVGLLLGHAFVGALAQAVPQSGLGVTAFHFVPEEAWLLLGSVLVGAGAALLPAVAAYRTNVAQVLAQR
ncbi:MAG: ABC transporter permease [Tunicatimonas sp.]